MAKHLSFDSTALTILDIDREEAPQPNAPEGGRRFRAAGRHFAGELDIRTPVEPLDEVLLGDLSDVLARIVAPATVTVADVVGLPAGPAAALTDFSDLDPLRLGAAIDSLSGQIRWAEIGSLVAPVASPVPMPAPIEEAIYRPRNGQEQYDWEIPLLPPRRNSATPRRIDGARNRNRTPLTYVLQEPGGAIRIRLGEWFSQPALQALYERSLENPNVKRALQASAKVMVAMALTVMTFNTDAMTFDKSEPASQQYALKAGRKATPQTSVLSPKPASAISPTTTSTTQAPATTTTTTKAPEPEKAIGSPVSGGRISSVFGQRVNPVTGRLRLHAGTDFAVSSGTPLKAAAAGTVTKAGWTSGYGYYTCISHSNGLSSCYAHQSKISVSVGQKVTRGQTIGLSGNTGNSTGAHLHFEVRQNGKPVDPRKFM